MWHGLNSKFQVCRSLPMLKIVEDNVGHGHQQHAVRGSIQMYDLYKGCLLPATSPHKILQTNTPLSDGKYTALV